MCETMTLSALALRWKICYYISYNVASLWESQQLLLQNGMFTNWEAGLVGSEVCLVISHVTNTNTNSQEVILRVFDQYLLQIWIHLVFRIVLHILIWITSASIDQSWGCNPLSWIGPQFSEVVELRPPVIRLFKLVESMS